MIQDIEEHDLSTNEVNNLGITFLPSAESLSATVFPKDNYNDEYHFSRNFPKQCKTVNKGWWENESPFNV